MFNDFSLLNLSVNELMWKNMTDPDRPRLTI